MVKSFLCKEISLDSLDEWIAKNSWNMHLDSDPSAQKLASGVELRLAEYSSGHLPLEQLRSELGSLLVPFEVNIEGSPAKSKSALSTPVNFVDAGVLQAPPSEIRFLEVSSF